MLKAKSRIVSLLTAGLSAVLALVLGVATLHIQPKTVLAETVETTETMSIIANKGEPSSDSKSISWTGKNITFLNEKNTSSTSIRTSDADHFRVYVGNKTTISTNNGSIITKIVINCVSSYVEGCYGAIGNEATYSGTTVTVTPTDAATSFTINTKKQWRLSSVAVTYEVAETCEHANISYVRNDDGTHNEVCDDCTNTINEGVDCTYSNGVCVCGYKEGTPLLEIAISGTNYTCVGGETITVNVTSENLTEEISWSSSSTSVATVENGVVTAVGMGKATITAEADGLSATVDVIVYPEADTVLSIAEALDVCEWTGASNSPYSYSAKGVVESANYNSTYDSVTVIIKDDTGSIEAYGMKGGSDLKVGKTIIVTGNLVNYNGSTPEFALGSTYEEIEDKELDRILEELNAVEAKMSLAYKYTQATEMQPVNHSAWTLVTDADTLKAGDKVVIAAKENAVALSTNQKSNNRGQTDITKDGNTVSFDTNSGVQELILEDGTKTGTFAFNTGSGYLYAASSSSNYLKTEEKLSDNSSWAITIADGTATIVAQGTYTKATMQYNQNSSLFACYASNSQQAISLYKYGEGDTTEEEVTTLSDSEFRLRCEVDASLLDITSERITEWGIQVSAGDKVVNYTTTAKTWGVEDGKAYVILSLGDIINEINKLTTEFTVQAYVIVDGFTHVSDMTKIYSVASMVKKYYTEENITEVEHLYNYLLENDAFKEEA